MPQHFDRGTQVVIDAYLADAIDEATSGAGVTVDDTLIKDGGFVLAGTGDLNGNELLLDAAGDTSITADTHNQIDIKIATADDFKFTANTFTALSGSAIATDTITETTTDAGVTIDSVLLKDGALGTVKTNMIQKSADFTASAAESGCTYEIGGVDKVATLPPTAPGLKFAFVLATAALSAGTGFSVSPNAADAIMGNGFTTADNKDAICAGSGDRVGDRIEVEGDAAGVGWFIRAVQGTWTRET